GFWTGERVLAKSCEQAIRKRQSSMAEKTLTITPKPDMQAFVPASAFLEILITTRISSAIKNHLTILRKEAPHASSSI
ncbi:hypothetical protein Lpp78_12461, partial [Lacticaseibacillus paracasei subsp. paracasei CNCM I-2877]